MNLEFNDVYKVDVSKGFPLEDETIDVVVTSPPYWGLRDYGSDTVTIWGGNPECKHEWKKHIEPPRGGVGKDTWVGANMNIEANNRGHKTITNFCIKCNAWKGQLGLEPHPQMYIDHIKQISKEIKRVLKKSGSFYLNIGDTYFGSSCGYGDYRTNIGKEVFDTNTTKKPQSRTSKGDPWLQPKQLVGIPFRVMMSLQDDGWILRNIIIWSKPNAMPSSVKDRRNNIWEPIFHFVKTRKYQFALDKIRQPHTEVSLKRSQPHRASSVANRTSPQCIEGQIFEVTQFCHPKGKNPGDVLEITTRGSPEAHYAVFPEELIKQLLLPHKGIVLDPFAGRGTTGKIAKKLGMDYFLFDISEKNIDIARRYLRRSGAPNYRKHEKRRNNNQNKKLINM